MSPTITDETLFPDDTQPCCMNQCQLAHLAGLADGSCTLRVSFRQSENQLGYEANPIIRTESFQERNPILGKLDEYCEQEQVRYNADVRNRSGRVSFQIRDADSIERFLDPLMPYFVVLFQGAQTMIHGVLPIFRSDDRLTEDSFVQLARLNDKLREGQGGSSSSGSKYTEEYFRDEFSLAKQ